jgi:hypothetical protein
VAYYEVKINSGNVKIMRTLEINLHVVSTSEQEITNHTLIKTNRGTIRGTFRGTQINTERGTGVLLRDKERDPKGWSTVLITALGSVLGKPVPRSQPRKP